MIAYVPVKGLGFACVDIDDLASVINISWSKMGRGYAAGYLPSKDGTESMHRMLLGSPKGQQVDHINGDKLDNRRSNLRLSNNLTNNLNKGLRKDNTSGYVGVSWCKIFKKWAVRISVGNASVHIGKYDCPIRAALAYDRTLTEWAGQHGRYNFP